MVHRRIKKQQATAAVLDGAILTYIGIIITTVFAPLFAPITFGIILSQLLKKDRTKNWQERKSCQKAPKQVRLKPGVSKDGKKKVNNYQSNKV